MLKLFGKKSWHASILPDNKTVTVAGGEKLLNAALDAGLDWPHDCRVGSCGTCRCYLKAGKIKPLSDFIYTLDAEDINNGAILACQSLLKSDIVVEVPLGSNELKIESFQGQIAAVKALTHDIQQVTVDVTEPCFQSAQAGQYAELSFDGLNQPRSYSFAHAPQHEASGKSTFMIRHVPGGEFTDWLFSSDRTGAPIHIRGPYGNFHLHTGEGAMICIAGGSGLAPILAIIEHAVKENIARDLCLFFGARTAADLYCLDDIHALAAQWHGRFEFVPVLSAEPADSEWRGARGLVTEQVGKFVRNANNERIEAYLCGPPPMVDAAIETCGTLGITTDHIYFDKFEDASSGLVR